ncbi:hypothetical protein WA016_03730 [Myxococcus stipitatus]
MTLKMLLEEEIRGLVGAGHWPPSLEASSCCSFYAPLAARTKTRALPCVRASGAPMTAVEPSIATLAPKRPESSVSANNWRGGCHSAPTHSKKYTQPGEMLCPVGRHLWAYRR